MNSTLAEMIGKLMELSISILDSLVKRRCRTKDWIEMHSMRVN